MEPVGEEARISRRKLTWGRRLHLTLTVLLAVALTCFVLIAFGSSRYLIGGPRMACSEIISEDDAPAAIRTFINRNGPKLEKVHDFLRESAFVLRNLHDSETGYTFVYVADERNSPCNVMRFLSIDGTLVVLTADRQLMVKTVE